MRYGDFLRKVLVWKVFQDESSCVWRCIVYQFLDYGFVTGSCMIFFAGFPYVGIDGFNVCQIMNYSAGGKW